MPPKLAVLVMAGLRLRLELSESVLLQALWWSHHLSSFSELLCRLPDVLPEPSRLPLQHGRQKKARGQGYIPGAAVDTQWDLSPKSRLQKTLPVNPDASRMGGRITQNGLQTEQHPTEMPGDPSAGEGETTRKTGWET